VPGEAVRILTGAAVPEGSERVLPQELVAVAGDELELVKPCGPNPWIRQPEEEAAPGQQLVPAGQRLGVADLGRLASCGVQQLAVTRRPQLGLLISGDELLPPGVERGPGQIWESNSTLLRALLARLGYEVYQQRVVVDEPDPLRAALQELADACDVVVSTGGVSAGDSDWIRPLVDELGAVSFWKLFLKPGRPFAWGQVAGVPFFGLPGNPVAAAITALQLLWPALQRLEGAEIQVLPRLKVQLEEPMRRGAGRPELARAQLVVAGDGTLLARVAGSQASSRIGSLQGADLLLEIPAELGALEAGTELWAQLLRLPLL
jgi:molybdopterin molybdotransferase